MSPWALPTAYRTFIAHPCNFDDAPNTVSSELENKMGASFMLVVFIRTRNRVNATFLISAFTAVSWAGLSAAQEIDYRKPVRSLLEIRSEGIVMQKWDISCGAAALTTVMTYGFNDPTPERLAAKWMLSHGNLEKIKSQHGFSLLDLKKFSESRGYTAKGLKDLTREQLSDLHHAIVPVIEYGVNPHFIVIRELRPDGTLDIADPGFGNRTMDVENFEEVWQGKVAFVLEKKNAP